MVISAAVGCSPALTNSMALFYEQRCLEWLIPLNMMFSYRLQDLVVAAAVAHLSQGFRAAAENMFESASLCLTPDLVSVHFAQNPLPSRMRTIDKVCHYEELY